MYYNDIHKGNLTQLSPLFPGGIWQFISSSASFRLLPWLSTFLQQENLQDWVSQDQICTWYLSAYFFSSAFRTIFIFDNVKHHQTQIVLLVLSMPVIFVHLLLLALFPEVTLRCHSQFQKRKTDQSFLLMLLKEAGSVKDMSNTQMRNWHIVSLKKNTMPAFNILHDLFWKSQSFTGFKSYNLAVQSWIKNSKWIGIAQMHLKKPGQRSSENVRQSSFKFSRTCTN